MELLPVAAKAGHLRLLLDQVLAAAPVPVDRLAARHGPRRALLLRLLHAAHAAQQLQLAVVAGAAGAVAGDDNDNQVDS